MGAGRQRALRIEAKQPGGIRRHQCNHPRGVDHAPLDEFERESERRFEPDDSLADAARISGVVFRQARGIAIAGEKRREAIEMLRYGIVRRVVGRDDVDSTVGQRRAKR